MHDSVSFPLIQPIKILESGTGLFQNFTPPGSVEIHVHRNEDKEAVIFCIHVIAYYFDEYVVVEAIAEGPSRTCTCHLTSKITLSFKHSIPLTVNVVGGAVTFY